MSKEGLAAGCPGTISMVFAKEPRYPLANGGYSWLTSKKGFACRGDCC